jgi:hypothetical protein
VEEVDVDKLKQMVKAEDVNVAAPQGGAR